MIHKVLKKSRRQNGKRVKTKCYYLRYRYGDMLVDEWRSLGVSQKEAAEKLADEFRKDWELEHAGLLPSKSIRNAASKTIADHLDDFLRDLKTRGKAGRDDEGAKKYRSRITKLMKGCKWKYLKDIKVDDFITWRSAKEQEHYSSRTLNHFLEGMNTFLNWLETSERISINPLKHVKKVDVKVTRKRRALSDEELARLVDSTPPYRGLIYYVAARSGLRRNELKLLVWGDLNLTPHPHIKARESTTKDAEEGFIPLMPEVLEALLNFRPEDYKPSDPIFHLGIPRADVLAQDLAKAGIPYRDSMGRYADFHGLRVTWCTFLQRNGVFQREAMALMRHKDERLTSILYTDVNHFPLFETIQALPALPQRAHIRAQISGKTDTLPIQRDKGNDGHIDVEVVENQGHYEQTNGLQPRQ